MKHLFVLIVFLTATSMAWAATTSNNRQDSIVYLGISPVGIHIPTLATRPISLGVYLGDFLVGAEYGKFSYNVTDNTSSASADFTNLGGYVRWFPGNSFNVLLALHKRSWDARAKVSYTDTATTLTAQADAQLKADAQVVTVGIGHQWIMDFGLVIGMDWLVISSGLSTTSSGTINSAQLATLQPSEKAQTEKELADLGEVLNKLSSVGGIAILSLGWSF